MSLGRWQGKFGKEYTDRNVVDWQTRTSTLSSIVPPDTQSVLEVGCNRGHNLKALQQVLPEAFVMGCEPASYARAIAQQDGLNVVEWSVYEIPEGWDMVMTSGVLIHVPPERFSTALRRIHSAANRYILAIEYQSDSGKPEMVEYRGLPDMLWKRDLRREFCDRFPDLSLVAMGDLDEDSGFADSRFWLFSKT